MRRILKFILYFFSFLLILSISTITVIESNPAKEKEYYSQMMTQLDSIASDFKISNKERIQIGTARISITPDSVMALAGYGARKPKEFETILDSVFIRTIIVSTPTQKAAIVSADLLIIHPDITKALRRKLRNIDWELKSVFLTATHSHSSIGQWAPGLVGGLFAGDHDSKVAGIIADRIIESIQSAENGLAGASFSYGVSNNPDLVLNRLVGEKGDEDPFMKTLTFIQNESTVQFSSFSAHATCLTSQSRNLSGDFPSYFHRYFEQDSSVSFSLYAAGAVASMGPETPAMDQFERTRFLGETLAKRVTRMESGIDSIQISSIRIPLELGQPQFKISRNLVLRPYLFDYAFGDEQVEISTLVLGNVLLVGTPCDFSGELALPLYQYAKSKGLELIITSFNGGYIGYITKDEWFDMEKYETRTMSWYGPGNGEYFSDIIKRIIEMVDENN